MWMHPEDARSDFILAAATAAVGWIVHNFVVSLGVYPNPGTLLHSALTVMWLFVLTGLVPLLLARYREDSPGAFGLGSDRHGVLPGLVLAVPVLVVGVLGLWADGVALPRALLGEFGLLPSDPLRVLVRLAAIAAVFAGSFLLYAFLTVRARNGFRRTELGQVEALRTFGMGAAGSVLLLGLLTSLAGICSVTSVLTTAAGLAALVLIADGAVTAGKQTSRAAVLAPAIVAVVIALLVDGGLFGGNLLITLYRGSAAAGTVIVLAVLVEAGRAWSGLVLMLAVAIYPSLLMPVPFGPSC